MRTEREMEEILHRHRVIARKRQIQLTIDDNLIPSQPFNLGNWTHEEKRKDILKAFGKLFISSLRMLLP